MWLLSLSGTRKQGTVKVKALHTFMGQSQNRWGQRAEELEEEIQVSWWEKPICASLDLRSLFLAEFVAFPRVHCSSFRLALLCRQALDFKWILPELDEFLRFYLRSSRSPLLTRE